MPIYEYKCENGHVFDIMQRMSDSPLKACVECEAPVTKVMQPVGISFKGSGFYSTDYSGTSKTTPPGESNAAKNGDSSSGSNGTDGKTDGKKSDSASGEKVASSSSSSGSSSSKD
ncbi:FmdB family zinc ribbon protein [Rubrobacter indicoceani]|uniref:FmdB family zinc ribbon protein n=1 Tax=Rubrobacter indicoceani TaxID=2051957 RepID=UPI000E5A1CC4|nr:FmdB family zinc ribbon protein [Rubrobacter indicoceani]